MSQAPGRGWLAATRTELLVTLVVSLLTYVSTLVITWVASRSSRLFTGLFPAVWAFLTSPVAIPLGLLLVGLGFVATNLLVFLLLDRARPNMSRLRAISLSGVIVAVSVAGLSMGFYIFRDKEPPRARDFQSLTSAGNVVQAAISPDGKFFVYAADHGGGRQSLRLGQVADPAAVLQIAEPAEVRYGGLAFSPDGLKVYFTRYGCNSTVGALYRMAALGGHPVKVKDGLPRFFGYALSPDGRSIAFVRDLAETDESALAVAPVEPPGAERLVAKLKMPAQYLGVPAWSPDGGLLTCPLRGTKPERVRVAGFRVATGDEVFSSDFEDEFVTRVLSLADGSGLFLSASRIYGPYRIGRVPYPGGRPELVTSEMNNYDGMSVTADSGDLVTVEDKLDSTVWVAPAGQPENARRVKDLAGKHNDYWGFSWTPDGRILYVSAARSRQNIHVMNADGTGQKELTNEGDNIDPCWAAGRDGRNYVVFTSKREGSYNIWKMDAEGAGDPVQLTKGDRDFAPHCSRDGAVVYTSEHKGRWTVWRVGLEGGEPTELTRRPSQWPAISRDGRVAFFYVDEQNVLKLGVLLPGGGPVRTYDIPCTASTWAELRWVRDGQEVTYVDTRDDVSNIWSLPLAGGAARQLTRFTEGRIFRYDWSDDGKLVLSRGTVKRNAVRVNFKDRGK
ncbi:MAG TPA: hypothetical protein VF611_00150, partial [Pyrinomonadaceae bacterium]